MTAKSTLVTKSKSQITGSLGQDSSYLSKLKIKLLADSVKNINFLVGIDPENMLKSFMAVKGVYDFNLVTDSEFTPLLVNRTSGLLRFEELT
jgi:hypothetical protein